MTLIDRRQQLHGVSPPSSLPPRREGRFSSSASTSSGANLPHSYSKHLGCPAWGVDSKALDQQNDGWSSSVGPARAIDTAARDHPRGVRLEVSARHDRLHGRLRDGVVLVVVPSDEPREVAAAVDARLQLVEDPVPYVLVIVVRVARDAGRVGVVDLVEGRPEAVRIEVPALVLRMHEARHLLEDPEGVGRQLTEAGDDGRHGRLLRLVHIEHHPLVVVGARGLLSEGVRPAGRVHCELVRHHRPDPAED
eukprot:scaffold48853_cov55-Phaeocystis_antarctica.AAC.2